MRVTFEKLNMQHFKNQEQFAVEFGPITRISGRNGSGKSGTGEAVTWLLFSVDMMGSKFDPTPLTAGPEDITKVELLLNIEQEGQDPIDLLLGKEIKKGKVSYLVNEIPEKAGRFDEVVSELFDKDLFLSIFNPVYFPSQHWKAQREQLLKYIEEPFKQEILAAMSKQHAGSLEDPLKKFSVEDLVKKYSPIYKDAKVKVERAGERVVTLKEQHEQANKQFEGIDLFAVNEELNDLEEKLVAIRENNNKGQEERNKKAELAFTLKGMKGKINGIATEAKQMQAEPLQDHCHTCKQPLNADAVEAVKESRQAAIAKLLTSGKELADQYRALYKEWEALPDPGQLYDSGKIQERIYTLKNILDSQDRADQLAAQVEQAEQARQQIRKEYLEAQEILESCKEYETVKAEQMVKKVGSLFDRLTVKLFKEHKNGNKEPDFEIEYQGKPYAKLSTAERIKAGLELVEALSGQAKKSLPVFVDNAESIITFKKPSGQLITATVKNSHLVVKQEGEQE
jgi:hypothetical protein